MLGAERLEHEVRRLEPPRDVEVVRDELAHDGLTVRRYRIAQVRVTTRTRIACPPEQVFDTLADLRNDTQWNSRVSSVELLSGEPIGPGSRFAMVNGGSPYDVTIATYDRPSRLGIEAKRQARPYDRVHVHADQ